MAYNFSNLDTKIKDIEEWLRKEYSTLRTGRATPAVLDGVRIESYGSQMPINQLAGVTIEGPKTIRITPWDMSQAKGIEKAIIAENLGLSVQTDDKGLRVVFPDLTSETRSSLNKVARERLEEARVSLRSERDRVWTDIQSKEESSEITEDDKFRLKDEMQKKVDALQKSLSEIAERKEDEIMNQ